MTLKEFMEKPDSTVLAEAAKCGSVQELKEFFASRGVSVTDSEAEKLYALMSKTKMTELSDEDLDGIAGGGGYYPIYDCPRGHTGRTWYLDSYERDIVDENCLSCQHVGYTDTLIKRPYCTKQSTSLYWEW